MRFIVDYSVASFFYLAVIVFFYFKDQHVKSTQTSIFKLMLFNGLIGAFLDVATTVMDANPEKYSIFLLYIINIIFLCVTQFALVLLATYSVTITGHLSKMKNKIKVVLCIPFIVNIILIISSPFWNHGIFIIDTNHHYYRSGMYSSIYFALIFYAILIIFALIRADRKIQLLKKHVLTFDIIISVFFAGFQYFHPEYLLNHSANCLSIMVFYLCIESLGQSVNSVTGAIDNSSFGALIREKYELHEDFGIVIMNLRSTVELGTRFGKKINDFIVLDFFNDIKHIFNYNVIAQIDRTVFAVILNSPYISRELLDIYDSELKTTFIFGEAEIQISHQTAGISSMDCVDNERLSTTLEYVLQHFNEKKETLIVADKEFFEVCDKRTKLMAAVEKAIVDNTVQVFYQPVHHGKEHVFFLEALARINDPVIGFIDPETFIRIAEEEGLIIKLGKQILEKTVQFVSKGTLEHFDIEYVSINLSAVQCMSKNICNDLTEIVDAYGVNHGKICFEVTETEAMEATRTVQKTMNDFMDRGFKLSLDDFGTGYSNFSYLFQFPFENVKLDKSMLWDSMIDEKKGLLFSSIARAIDELNMTCICEGVEKEEHIRWLDQLGIHLHQGYFYSKPVPEDQLIEYLLSVD